MDIGTPLATGRASDVYLVGHEQVLRRSRTGADVTREAHVMRYVRAAGFPAPRVDAAEGGDLTMELLRGPTLLQSLAAGETSLVDGAQVLVDLLRALHALPLPPDDDPATAALGAPFAGTDSGEHRILHLDLHPANVVLTVDGPALLDWASARPGPPALDTATTALIVAEVAVDDNPYASGAKVLLDALLATTDEDVRPYLDDALAVRRADPGLVPEEVSLLPAARAFVERECVQRLG
ncbi:phosphotransferase family protein [Oerskovia flava]|uniref:phosphotransferase family protein n=1 Tax=Oerskovia flava TaxID=2986422 RepID=UPI00224097D6|nr:phosphotransferase [Oerskovia sp. JB1-3-2]